jgi:hypothetical protein
MIEQIGKLKILSLEQLINLNTKRLLAYKKSVIAQKSALYNKNIETIKISHPFDLESDVRSDYEEGRYILSPILKKLIDDARDFKFLDNYHRKIKEILATREHVEK